MRELIIWMEGTRVGRLLEYDRRDLSVVYDESYRTDTRSTPLSLSMPLTVREHSSSAVANYLQGLLPDDDEVVARWAQRLGERPTDLFGLIQAVGVDVPGAAIYLPPDEDPSTEGASTPVTEADVAEMLAEIRTDRSNWHSPRHAERWSLAGAQAKIALAHDSKRGWSVPGGAAATTHILKPAIAQLRDQDLNEVVCMKAASALGLRSAPTEIGRFGDERAIVSTRYDRRVGPDGTVLRIHQEDFCQALGVHPDRKYQSDGGPAPDQQFALLHRQSSVHSNDVALLRDAFAYNWLILGTDAHAKNHSLVLGGQRVWMAPLYDIASLAPYVQWAPKAKFAQKIGGTYVAGKIGERNWVRFAADTGVDPDETLQRVRELAGRVPDALGDAAAALDLTEDEKKATAHLVGTIMSWAEQCRTKIGPASTPPNPAQPRPRPEQGRAPKGTASGGQFLPIQHAESDVRLDEEDD